MKFEKPVLFTSVDIIDQALIKYDFVKEMIKGKSAKFVPLNHLCDEINAINKNELWRINDVSERSENMKKFLNYGNSINLQKLIGIEVDNLS